MKNKKQIIKSKVIPARLLLLSFMLLFFACEDNRMNNLTPDKIYLLNSGLIQEDVYNSPDYVYNLYAIKSGIGKYSAELSLTVDENILTQYNVDNKTNYTLLPAELYQIKTKTILMGEKDYRIPFQISMNVEGIKQLKITTGLKYAVPFQTSILSGTLESNGPKSMISIVVPNVVEPSIEYSTPGMLSSKTIIDFNSAEETLLFANVQTTFDNSEDLNFTLAADESLITAYNTANKTNYRLLSEKAYKIDPTSLVISKNSNNRAIKITILKKGFQDESGKFLLGDYLIPLRINSVSKYSINSQKNVQLIPVSFKPLLLNRSKWAILDYNSCICMEPKYDALARVPQNLLDGNTETFWGSKWDNPIPLPNYFVFDMQKEQSIYQIDLVKPYPTNTWRGNIKSGYFEVSNDNKTWTKLADWTITEDAVREHQFSMDGTKARYIKFFISKPFTYMGTTGGAQMDLAEFRVWGN